MADVKVTDLTLRTSHLLGDIFLTIPEGSELAEKTTLERIFANTLIGFDSVTWDYIDSDTVRVLAGGRCVSDDGERLYVIESDIDVRLSQDLDQGTELAGTIYYLWIGTYLGNDVVVFSTSDTMPFGLDNYHRLTGDVLNNFSSDIVIPTEVESETIGEFIYPSSLCIGRHTNSHMTICLSDGSPAYAGINTNSGTGSAEDITLFSSIPLPDNVLKVVRGGNNTYAILDNGELWGWGENSIGQLGQGGTATYNTPVRIGEGVLSNVSDVQVSRTLNDARVSVYALDGDGDLWSWGFNQHGQLGTGDVIAYYTPQNVLSTVQSFSLGHTNHSCSVYAIKTDSTLYTWGRNDFGQLGQGTDGDFYSTPTIVSGLSNVDTIFAQQGSDSDTECYAFIKQTNGNVYATGRNNYGQLALGDITNRNIFSQVTLSSTISFIEASGTFAIFVYENGTVEGCGNNEFGQLGNGNTTNSSSLVNISFSEDIIRVLTNPYVTYCAFALSTNGNVYSWGNTTLGQLGNGVLTANGEQTVPYKIQGLSNITDIGLSGYGAGGFGVSGFALKDNGKLYAWGSNRNGCAGLGSTIVNIASPISAQVY